MGKGKAWLVYEQEYVEDGVVAVVRARSAASAVRQVRRWRSYRYDTDGHWLGFDERILLVAVRMTDWRCARDEFGVEQPTYLSTQSAEGRALPDCRRRIAPYNHRGGVVPLNVPS